MLVWTGRQNNLGPNSHDHREDYNLSRLVWSVSWPTRRGKKKVLVDAWLWFSNTLEHMSTLTWIPVGLFIYSNIRFYLSTHQTRTCQLHFSASFAWEKTAWFGFSVCSFCKLLETLFRFTLKSFKSPYWFIYFKAAGLRCCSAIREYFPSQQYPFRISKLWGRNLHVF